MPEMHFRIEWPGGEQEDCYSPSYVIEDYLEVGQSYLVPEFLRRAESALELASERVRARYGFACSSALDQLARLQSTAQNLSETARVGTVKIVSFDKHAARAAKKDS